MTETHGLGSTRRWWVQIKDLFLVKKQGQEGGKKVKKQRGLVGPFLARLWTSHFLSLLLEIHPCSESISPELTSYSCQWKDCLWIGTKSPGALCPRPCILLLTYWQILSIIECLFVSLGGLLFKILVWAHAVSGEKCKTLFLWSLIKDPEEKA